MIRHSRKRKKKTDVKLKIDFHEYTDNFVSK